MTDSANTASSRASLFQRASSAATLAANADRRDLLLLGPGAVLQTLRVASRQRAQNRGEAHPSAGPGGGTVEQLGAEHVHGPLQCVDLGEVRIDEFDTDTERAADVQLIGGHRIQAFGGQTTKEWHQLRPLIEIRLVPSTARFHTRANWSAVRKRG